MRWFFMLAGVLVIAAPAPAVQAQTIDPHAVYEQKCAGCHTTHAPDLVETLLDAAQDPLAIARTGQPLASFLKSGHGRASPAEIDALIALFTRIQLSDGLFRSKCRICHVRAKETARLKLVIRDDRLIGRYTGRDIETFLHNHGRLEPQEIPIMLDALRQHVLTKPAT